MQALFAASRTCVRSADPGSASSPRILSTAHHYESVDNKRETKRKKGKRKKLKKKKKESNNETTIVSLRIVIRIVVPFATRNKKLEFRKHVEETFQKKSETDDALPPLDGWREPKMKTNSSMKRD